MYRDPHLPILHDIKQFLYVSKKALKFTLIYFNDIDQWPLNCEKTGQWLSSLHPPAVRSERNLIIGLITTKTLYVHYETPQVCFSFTQVYPWYAAVKTLEKPCPSVHFSDERRTLWFMLLYINLNTDKILDYYRIVLWCSDTHCIITVSTVEFLVDFLRL